MAANVSIGINVIWDNQKQMQKAKEDLLSLGKTALLSADDFGTTGTQINKAFAEMLPSIKTSSQALKKFTAEGYSAWVNYQKEVDEATKGQQKALANQIKNMQAGFDTMAKAPDTTIEKMREYILNMAKVQAQYDKVIQLNKTAVASFNSSSFLKNVEKQRLATAKLGDEFLAVSQAMDTIKKKGATLELGNAKGKQTANIKALRTEYINLQNQLDSMNMAKFNKSLQLQYSYTESTKGVLEALKEKYKTLDSAIRGMISSGDIKNLESYKMQLNSVGNSITRLQTASEQFNKEGFFTNLDKNTKVIEAMDGRLAAVNSRMKMLRTTILKFTESGKANESQIRELRSEYSKLSEEQKKLQKETNGTKLRITNLLKSFVSAQAIVWGVRMVFNKFVGTLKEAAEVAAAAEETMNLFEVVFEGVGDSAEDMASRMSKAFGVAESSIAQGLSVLGDFSEGLGMSNQSALDFANTLSSRMLDVISFKNVTGDTTDILKNLSSGLAGNTENFRTWGYVIKESSVKLWLAQNNMDKLTGTALELAKVQARAAIFMEQSSNAAGDMARTFDSTVNVARRLTEANKQLNENMGVGINELITPVKKWSLGIVEGWNRATEAKKAYADVNINESEKDNLAENNKIVKAYYKAYKESKTEKTLENSGDLLTNKYFRMNSMGYEDFSKMVTALSGSVEDTVASLESLNIKYDESFIAQAKEEKAQKERERLDNIANQALEDFGETLKLWTSTGNGGIYSAVTENLQSMLTPFETATGTERSSTELATSYQSELKAMFEETYNQMITAQNEGNKATAKLAETTLATITKQYADTQSLIDEEARIAQLDSDNAEAFKEATEAFKSSMDSILSNINAMRTNVDSLVRDTNVSASMIGSDSSLVSTAQNRATALVGVRASNLQARQDFATEKKVDLSKYQGYLEQSRTTGNTPKGVENVSVFKEYKALVNSQEDNLKATNLYYDLLEINAKTQLGYSDAQLEITAQSVANYQAIADESLKELDLKLKNKEITQQYYDDEKKILGEHVAILESMNFDKLKESLDSLSSINTSRSLSIGGGGLFTGANQTYQDNLKSYNDIRATVIAGSNSGIMSDKDADKLALKLQDIKDAYAKDKDQAYLDATGISTGADMTMFTNIKSIMDSFSGIGGVASAVVYVLSQFDSFGDLLSIVTDALQALAPMVDSFLAPLMLIIEPLTSLLGHILMPILEVLFPILVEVMKILLPIIAAIDTVIVWLDALGGMIKDIVTFNWGHIDDNFKDAVSETTDIWKNLNTDLKDLETMTISNVSDLEDANSDYIDAIKDMVGKGLLTGQEALEMVSKKNGTSYTGSNYEYVGADSYNRGGSTVNIGTMTIDAKGKTMEQIFDEIRQASYETSVTGDIPR